MSRNPTPCPQSGPILVTGSRRSGSTWVGNVLSLAAGTGYVHEPFNTKTRQGICAARFPADFTYVTREPGHQTGAGHDLIKPAEAGTYLESCGYDAV